MYHNNIVDTLKKHLYPSHIRQVLRPLGAVSMDVLRNAFLTAPEMVVTENWINSVTYLLDPIYHFSRW